MVKIKKHKLLVKTISEPSFLTSSSTSTSTSDILSHANPWSQSLEKLASLCHDIQQHSLSFMDAKNRLFDIADMFVQTQPLRLLVSLQYPEQWIKSIENVLQPNIDPSQIKSILLSTIKSYQQQLTTPTTLTLSDMETICPVEKLVELTMMTMERYPMSRIRYSSPSSSLTSQDPSSNDRVRIAITSLSWGDRLWLCHVRELLLQDQSSFWNQKEWISVLRQCPYEMANVPSEEELYLLFFPYSSYLPLPLPCAMTFLANIMITPSYVSDRDRFLHHHGYDGFLNLVLTEQWANQPFWTSSTTTPSQRQEFWKQVLLKKTGLSYTSQKPDKKEDDEGEEEDEWIPSVSDSEEEEDDHPHDEEEDDEEIDMGDWEDEEEKKTKTHGSNKKGKKGKEKGKTVLEKLKSKMEAYKKWKKEEFGKFLEISSKQDKLESKKQLPVLGSTKYKKQQLHYLGTLEWYPLFFQLPLSLFLDFFHHLHFSFVVDKLSLLKTYRHQKTILPSKTKTNGILLKPSASIKPPSPSPSLILSKPTLLSIPTPRFEYVIRLLLQTRPWIPNYQYSYFTLLSSSSSSDGVVPSSWLTFPFQHQKYLFPPTMISDISHAIQHKSWFFSDHSKGYPIRIHHVLLNGNVMTQTKENFQHELEEIYQLLYTYQNTLLSFSTYQQWSERLLHQSWVSLPSWFQNTIVRQFRSKIEAGLTSVYQYDTNCDLQGIVSLCIEPLQDLPITCSLQHVLMRGVVFLSFLQVSSPFYHAGRIFRKRLEFFLYHFSCFFSQDLSLLDLCPLYRWMSPPQQKIFVEKWNQYCQQDMMQCLFSSYQELIPTVRKTSLTSSGKSSTFQEILHFDSWLPEDIQQEWEHYIYQLWISPDVSMTPPGIENIDAVLLGVTDFPLEDIISFSRLENVHQGTSNLSLPFRQPLLSSIPQKSDSSPIQNDISVTPTSSSIYIIPHFFQRLMECF